MLFVFQYASAAQLQNHLRGQRMGFDNDATIGAANTLTSSGTAFADVEVGDVVFVSGSPTRLTVASKASDSEITVAETVSPAASVRIAIFRNPLDERVIALSGSQAGGVVLYSSDTFHNVTT